MGERCRCGAELLPHLHFCVGCGADRQAAATVRREPAPTLHGRPFEAPRQPPPTWHQPVAEDREYPGPPDWTQQARGNPSTPWLIALSVLTVLLLSATAVLVTLRPGLVGLEREPAVVSPAAAPAVPQSAPALSAREELAAQVDRDRPRVETVTGSWVPQLSSKKPGTVDSGVTHDDGTILDHYRGLAARYPGTALLWSGDWPVFKGSDYWVVISTQSFPTAAAANAWCDAQGFGRDDCLAKNISHTGGPAGTTVAR